MKSFLILASLIVATTAQASALKIPLFVGTENNYVPAARINELYKLQGNDKLQEILVVEATNDSIKNAKETYWNLHEKVTKLAEKLNKDLYLATDLPGGFKSGNYKTCYSGSVDEVMEIAGNLTDSVYSDQLGIFGYKYKKQTVFLEGQDQEETELFLNESSDTWRNWKSTNDDILVLSHQSDSGDDVNEGIISKCK